MGIYNELAKLDSESPTPRESGSASAETEEEDSLKNRTAQQHKVITDDPNGSAFARSQMKPTVIKQPSEGGSNFEGQQVNSKNSRVRSAERTSDGSYERTDVRKDERVRIRHAFDIFEDQLRALQLLQLQAVQAGKPKPKLGQMVQEGIDLLLKAVKDGKLRVY
jgi:hypothetical protein